MPTYEYECSHCGHKFELSQKMTDKPVEKCPECHKKVRRLIGSGSGIIFKGSGFYATDYRKGSKGEAQKSKPATCPKAKDGCNACRKMD
ncbi:MAG: FmdB family zinc ribbon protein [Candidatus Omnitrophota bacterium]